jgi:Kef-type K+ transport system membrane component KefB
VLLGFFFMTVGMKADVNLIIKHASIIAAASVALVLIKATVLAGLAWLLSYPKRQRLHFQ